MIYEGEDFQCPIQSLRAQAYQKAALRQARVSVLKQRNGVYTIQARALEDPKRNRYDWDALLDGEVHQLRLGVDILAKPTSFQVYARQVAVERGLRVSIKSLGDSLFLQAIREPAPPAPTEPPRPSAEVLAELPFEMDFS